MNLTRKRWLLLVASCVINLFAGSIYAWSVFASPLAERLGGLLQTALTPADLALAFSLASGLAPIPMIFGGAVNDRMGPRFVIMGGGLLMGLGLYLSGSAESVYGLIVSYGLFFGLGLGLVYGCTISNTMKFFPDHRGLVGGLTTGIYGLSSVIVPPVAATLIASYGITTALEVLGLVIGGVIIAGGFLSFACPSGFVPEGYAPEASQGGSSREANLTWREMLRDARFAPMIILLMCGATAGMMVLSQGFTIARTQIGMDAAAASMAVSFMALSNTFGRLCAGTASDYLGRVTTLAAGLAVAIAGLACLTLADAEAVLLFYTGLLALGFSFGCFMGVYPGFTAQTFGSRHNSVNFGIMFTGFSVAGILGPALMKVLAAYGLTVCYGAAALISALGFAAILFYRRAARRTQSLR